MKTFIARQLPLPLLLLIALLVAVGGCRDLSVDNVNDPVRERALGEASGVVALLEGATANTVQMIVEEEGVHMGGLADQTTATNRFFSFWDFAYQPRQRLNNRTTYSDAEIIEDPWLTFNAAVSSANTIIQRIELDGEDIVLDDGTDVSQKLLASAYFIRGVARGYIGLIYNQGYIAGPETDPTVVQDFAPYSEIIAAAVEDIDQGIALAEQVSGFQWDLLPGGNAYSFDQFVEIANSLSARILLNEARTQEEADGWSPDRWQNILDRAEAGLGGALEAFAPTSVGPFIFFCNYCDWNTFLVTGGIEDGAGYLPTDVKLLHLFDGDYPVDYPDEGNLDPVETADPRIQYFKYTTNYGFLNASRDRSLFTNYWNLRMYAANNWGESGYPIPVMTRAETQYIKAEANVRLGNKAAAAEALENSPFGSVPTDFEPNLPAIQLGAIEFPDGADGLAAGLTISAGASDDAFACALHKEYSIELDMLGGIGLQWYFMRRHNLLQEGTPLHYPVPGRELEITFRDYYTFGGADNAGEAGTADGTSSWKTNSCPAMLSGGGGEEDVRVKLYGPQSLQIKRTDLPPSNSGGQYKGNH